MAERTVPGASRAGGWRSHAEAVRRPDPTDPADRTVREIMSRVPVSISIDATLREAQATMASLHIHHLLVYEDARLVGILSDRDILRHLSANLGTLAEQRRDTETLRRKVFHATTYRPQTVPPNTPLAEAAAILLGRDFSCLPVCNAAGEAVGIITTRDLLRGLVSCLLPNDALASSAGASDRPPSTG